MLANTDFNTSYGSTPAGLPRSSSIRTKANADGTLTIIEPSSSFRNLSWFSCFVLFNGFILYIVSCVVVNYCNTGSGYYFGAFRWCDENDSNNCGIIDKDCIVSVGSNRIPLGNCSELNAFRALLVMGLISSFNSYILIVLQFFYSSRNKTTNNYFRYAVLGFGYFSSLCGFISMILFIDYKDTTIANLADSVNINNSNGIPYGPAFICSALAWAITLLGSILYTILHCIERHHWLSEREGLLQSS